MFRQHQDFTLADMQKALSVISAQLEQSNINIDWFDFHQKQLWQKGPIAQEQAGLLASFSTVDKQWLAYKTASGVTLLIPFDAEQVFSRVKQQLLKQGVLKIEDEITPDIAQEIAHIQFRLSLPSLEDATAQTNLYYIGTVLLIFVMTLALLFAARTVMLQQQRKMAYLHLREQFVNLVSHELKTPLAAIRLIAETPDKRAKRQMDLKNYPEKIVNEADKLTMMVENLLALNRAKSGEMALNVSRFNLAKLVTRVAEQYGNVEVCCDLDEQLTVEADEVLLHSVLSNLLSNAQKYCDKDKATVGIRRLEPNLLIFNDNGRGIDKPLWPKVFEEFYRVDSGQNQAGSGIGLALSRLIMHQQGGDLTIVESSGAGTTWHIELGINKAQTDDD